MRGSGLSTPPTHAHHSYFLYREVLAVPMAGRPVQSGQPPLTVAGLEPDKV